MQPNYMFLLAALLCSSCGFHQSATVSPLADSDGATTAAFPATEEATIREALGAPTWTRIDAHTISFKGGIPYPANAGSLSTPNQPTLLEGFNAIYRPGDDTLVVNSFGGSIDEGLALGQRLLPLSMTVIVDGVCGSACANYLFIAGDKKQIRRGWVGYHGNLTAVLGVGWPDQVKVAKAQGLTDEAIAALRLQRADVAKKEQAFFAAAGVSQDLFDQAQIGGNGSTRIYFFWCPTPSSFIKYGITNVSGTQDLTFSPMNPPNVLQ